MNNYRRLLVRTIDELRDRAKNQQMEARDLRYKGQFLDGEAAELNLKADQIERQMQEHDKAEESA